MEDLTLEEIAEQLENVLSSISGTTIAPGTISPIGITFESGERKLSWPELIKRLQEGAGLTEGELLPDIPGGFAAPTFYQAAATAGFLPSGMSTFTQPPFTEGFVDRVSTSAGGTAPTATPATPATQATQATQAAIQSATVGQRRRILDAVDQGETGNEPTKEETAQSSLAAAGLGVVMPGEIPGLGAIVKGGILGTVSYTHLTLPTKA